jgi:hypothetical protein
MSFSGDIAKWRKNIEQDSEKMLVTLCLSIQSRTIEETPVDTGRLRNNWFLGVNQPNLDSTDTSNKSGGDAINQGLSVRYSIKLGDRVYLTNNMPYARRIEYDGWSKVKAPQGMLRVTVKEHKAKLRQYGFNVRFNDV